MFSFPQVMTWRVTFWVSPWISTNKSQVYQMSPFLLWEGSAFLAHMGTGSFVVGRLCFLTKCWSMQEMSAPLLTSAWISMTFMECKGTISWTGICIDLVSDFTVTLAHTGEMGGHCIVEVLPFENPWGWRKFCERFLWWFFLSFTIRHLDFSMVLVHPSLPSYWHCWAAHDNPCTIKPSASSETSPYVSLLFIYSHSLQVYKSDLFLYSSLTLVLLESSSSLDS